MRDGAKVDSTLFRKSGCEGVKNGYIEEFMESREDLRCKMGQHFKIQVRKQHYIRRGCK